MLSVITPYIQIRTEKRNVFIGLPGDKKAIEFPLHDRRGFSDALQKLNIKPGTATYRRVIYQAMRVNAITSETAALLLTDEKK